MKKNSLNRFLFKSIILIVLSVFVLYSIVSYITDEYANSAFSRFAENYSADYIFKGNYLEKSNLIEKINKSGGFVVIIEENGKIIYSSKKIDIKRLDLEKITLLQNGKYQINNVEHYASITKIPDKSEYGLVVLPSKIVNNVTMVTLENDENVKFIIYFLLIRSAFLIPAIVLLIFISSKSLKKKLVIPLQNLELAFSRLRHEDYSTILEKEDIQEFNDLNSSFQELSNTLEELNKTKQDYKRKRSQLFSDISHDFKTPITVIKGYSQAIIEKKIKNDEIDKYVALIKKNADNLEKLTIELSDIVNYERSDYELHLETIDIIEYFRQAIIDFLPLFEEKNISIKTDIPDDKIYYKIDVKLFFRVLQNLMSNIINHNPTGIEVLCGIEVVDDKINITIADTGVKINDSHIEDIFDEFKTYDDSRNSSQSNNGLGLAIVKKIIKLHKGEIYLDTNYAGYSKAFIIRLFL